MATPGLSYCASQVRQYDPDRFLTCLFAPAGKREALFALYAFNIELSRIRETVTEPMMGLIRLQWWREAIADLYEGRTRGHQVLQVLAPVLPGTVDQTLIQHMIDARELDVEADPPVSDKALKHYAHDTGGALMCAAARLLGVADEPLLAAAYEIGEAVTLVGLVRSIPWHAAQGKSYLPSSLLSKLAIDPTAPHKARPFGIEIVTMLIAHEAKHLLRLEHPAIPRAAMAAFLPGRLAYRYIRRLARVDYDPFLLDPAAPSALKPLGLAWAWVMGVA